MSVLLAAAAQLAVLQVGPFVSSAPQPASALPPEMVEHRERQKKAVKAEVEAQATPSSTLQACLDEALENPSSAVETAEAWRRVVKGPQRAQADECLGTALTELDSWPEAETAFLDGRNSAMDDQARKARLGAMAGNAALAQGAADRALATLDSARDDALAAGNRQLAGDIQVDRSRALVALKRMDEAVMALDEARNGSPDNAEGWLLSATLSRRMNKLTEAQAQIEKAAALLPVDPQIGLEAGVIAVLSGRDEAARKSWESVIATAPKSEAANTARNYLAQLDPPVAKSAPTP